MYTYTIIALLTLCLS